MAKTTSTKSTVAKKDIKKEQIENNEVIDKTTEEVVENTNASASGSPSIGELLELVQNLQNQLTEMKNKEKEAEALEANQSSANDTTVKLLETLVNSKSQREITIVHTEEMFNGLCTAVDLSNLHIQFTRLGEQRVLSWQQFEELVSKYRGFINRGVIKVAAKDRDLCDKYQIQCYEPEEEFTLTTEILNRLPDMSKRELEDTYKKLSEDNQKILLSYWLGKCYAREDERDERFYDRYKIELLNDLSKSFLFDNIIADINNNYAHRKRG